jgi:hypothetical protein
VVEESVVGWSCVHTERTGRGMFRKGCLWNCRWDDGIFRWSACVKFFVLTRAFG